MADMWRTTDQERKDIKTPLRFNIYELIKLISANNIILIILDIVVTLIWTNAFADPYQLSWCHIKLCLKNLLSPIATKYLWLFSNLLWDYPLVFLKHTTQYTNKKTGIQAAENSQRTVGVSIINHFFHIPTTSGC